MFFRSRSSDRFVELASGVLVVFAGTALAAMMFLMAIDVICRYFFNAPIPGGLELVEFLMAITVPLSIAYCQSHRSHIAVDLVMDHCPRLTRTIIGVIVRVLSIIFIGLVSWQNFAYIKETYQSGLTSAVLKIPAYPFVLTVAVGMLAFVAIMLVHLFVRKSKEKSDGTN